ncbi:tetratricopeptide repeat protein [Clostridium sp.]|uniref:tetratricopeptide repeat protein n=1 Tax=Clostridium sp. TaxID=1506 RepID=UPI00346397EA
MILSEETKARTYCADKLKLNLTSDELDDVIHIGEFSNLLDVLTAAYVKKGNLLYDENLFNEAFIYYSKTLDLYNTTPTKDDDMIFIYNKLAKCKIKTLCYEEALSYLCTCHTFTLESKDKNNYYNCTYNIALTYKKLNDFDNCILYIDKLLDNIDINKNLIEYIEGAILKANCYLSKNSNFQAITLYKELLHTFGDKLGIYQGYIYNNLALAYSDENNSDVALKYFYKAIDFKTSYDRDSLDVTLMYMAKFYMKIGSNKEAISKIKDGLKLAKEYSHSEHSLLGYSLLEQIYRELNDIEELRTLYSEMLKNFKDVDPSITMEIYSKLSNLLPDNIGYNKLDTIFRVNKL